MLLLKPSLIYWDTGLRGLFTFSVNKITQKHIHPVKQTRKGQSCISLYKIAPPLKHMEPF